MESGLARVEDTNAAEQLARYLLSDSRTLPAVVVTIPASETEPFIDADRIVDELRDLATVHVMPTRDVSWAFSRAMPERTQVYGGAGRVYPVGRKWVENPHASPLRFAFSAPEGEVSTERLINDGLRMASDAGLVGVTRQPGLVPASGVVRGLIEHTGRAIVELDGGRLATIHEELTFPDVALDRFLRPGMQVMGAHDQRSHRLDIRRMARSAAECLQGYGPGDVVLAQVESVSDTLATLLLHPEAPVEIRLEDVTSNPHDRLTELMSPGEVIPARVVRVGDPWSLSLADVDDDEPILEAPALLPDGPVWLEQAKPVELLELLAVEVAMPSGVADSGAHSVDEVLLDQSATAAANLTATIRPTPLLLDRNVQRNRTPGAAKSGSSGQLAPDDAGRLAAEVADARAESEELRTRVDFLRVEFAALRQERDLVTSRLYAVEQQLATAHATITRHRTELRKTRKRQKESSGSSGREICFLDPAEQFLFEVQVAWARRIPPSDKHALPIRDYCLGPRFLRSLDSLHGVDRAKVLDVVVEVITGLAVDVPARELHQLRQSEGGGTPAVVRADDGATCWRAAIQSHTPSARRLHYWQRRDGSVELSRVVLHDDMDP